VGPVGPVGACGQLGAWGQVGACDEVGPAGVVALVGACGQAGAVGSAGAETVPCVVPWVLTDAEPLTGLLQSARFASRPGARPVALGFACVGWGIDSGSRAGSRTIVSAGRAPSSQASVAASIG
jgi:hypothetical protein